jgi:two-component system OmpR family response regulator
MTILVVEDHPPIADLIRRYLENDGHDVEVVARGAAALDRLAGGGVDLVVLDLGLPDMDGLDVARRVARGVPVVMLTARGDEPERMAGFAAGADDYLPKPFSPRELVARVRAVLRRGASDDERAGGLAVGELALEPDAREATVGGEAVELTLKEFDLLWYLVDNRGLVVSRDALLERVWGYAEPGATRTVDQHVAQLRRKLGGACPIETVRGLGYKVARR